MRYSHRAIQLLLIAPFLLSTAVAQSPNDFQRMDNLPNLDCTTAWNSVMPYCNDSDFENGAPCGPGCTYGVESTQEGIQQVCKGAHYAPDSLMALFMAGKAAQILCPNAVTTQAMGGSIRTSVSVSLVSRPTSLALPTAAALSTVTSTVTTTQAFASSVSSSFGSLTTTVVLHSTFVTHVTATASSTFNSTSSSTSTSTSTPSSTSSSTRSTSSTSTTSSSSTATPTTSGIIQTAVNGASVTVQSSTTTGIIQTAINGASVTVQSSTTSGFIRTAVNGGSVTVLSSKPAQTSSTNPDAFGGGGSPFEISSPASRSISSLRSWTSVFALGCIVWMVWV